MNKTFAIGIPTLNRFDLLHPALMFYKQDFPNTKIYVVDNGSQNIKNQIAYMPNVILLEQSDNLGVAKSWNLLCNEIYKNHENALILNDDIYLGKKEFEIETLLRDYKSDFYVTLQDWCAFILPKKTFKKVGEFDIKFFPAYFEDNDYHYRMKLLGLKYMQIPFLNPYIYKSSMTIDKEPKLRDLIQNNREYYISKWGGEPMRETFKKPFNR
jgi:GT2 family glycosyltransferase